MSLSPLIGCKYENTRKKKKKIPHNKDFKGEVRGRKKNQVSTVS